MSNLDRGMIKWQPFNSVVSSKEVVRELILQKNKIKMPTLSDDQKIFIEKKLIEALYENDKIHLAYYNNGKFFEINDFIKKIDFTFHKIYFPNKVILFEQIVKILT